MNFPFNAEKATEAAAYFVARSNGSMEKLKLVKLLYISEREAIRRRGISVYGGKYCSLPHGPISSEALDLMNNRSREPKDQKIWDATFHRDGDRNIILHSQPSNENLSPSEIDIFDEILIEHGGKTAGQIRNWCHKEKHVPEYVEVELGTSRPIKMDDLCRAVGLDEEKIEYVNQEAKLSKYFSDVL